MRRSEIRDSSSPTYDGNDGHSASSCFEPMRQSEIRCSSSATHGGNDGHSASSTSPSISFQPPDKIHIPKVMTRLPEIRDSSSTSDGSDGSSEFSSYSFKKSTSRFISYKSPDKIHMKKVMLPPEIKDSSRTFGGNDGHRATTYFEPRTELSEFLPSSPRLSPFYAPEKKLTLFALHLAIIEKSANALGQLAFIWATVVLLGGFASALKPKDFWFVTIILVVEGARLFTRSSELEWQHQSTRILPAATSRPRIQSYLIIRRRTVLSFASRPCRRLAHKLKRAWLPADVPPPYSGWVFVLKVINHLVYWLQLFAAVACLALSLIRLGQQDYGEDAEINEKSALNVFYGLALAVALMFLLETGYWTWKIRVRKLVEQVNKECNLGDIGLVSLRRFFYDAYSKCIDGSIFDGWKMDLVSYAEELLHSDSLDEQIIGASILKKFVVNRRFAGDTLRKIGSSTSVIERLIEMLNWEDPAEIDIRLAASVIVSKLASRKHNALRVAAIPGAMESIASLLHTGGGTTDGRPYEASPRAVVIDKEDYEFSTFNVLGLLILKRLARDHENCWKIGNARGLLARIIHLTSSGEALLHNDDAPRSRIKTLHRALQLVKILVCTTGETGKTLRRDISDIVYLLSYIRELLQYGESHLKLQVLGVEILTSLGMNEKAREKIGATGSMMRLILNVFFRPMVTEEVGTVCNEAGEALAMLILESRRNCERMLSEDTDVVRKLVDALAKPALRLNATMILRGLCAYSAPEQSSRLQIVAEAMPMVLKTIMEEKEEKEKLLEVSVGLAQQILNFRNLQVSENEIEKADIKDEEFVGKLVEILRRYKNPESKVPKMRRFVIELAITLMMRECKYIELFRDLGMKQVLVQTAETTSELECFNVFSGSQGLDRHEVMISSLVGMALELLGRDDAHTSADDSLTGKGRRRRPTSAPTVLMTVGP